MYHFLFFGELLILFLLSRSLTQNISQFLFKITKSKKIAIYILAFLFLPGTLLHEISHFLMAKILFVHAGKIRLFPQLTGNEVKLGTVEVGKTDLVRQFLIGVAPFFFGTLLICAIMYFTLLIQIRQQYLLFIAAGYSIFEIGNTMFSSKKDLEGALTLFIILIPIGFLIFFFGFQADISKITIPQLAAELFKKGSLLILPTIIIDIMVILILRTFNK